MPRFCDILTLAEAIAVELQEYEVADAIIAEEPERYGIVRRLGKDRETTYDAILKVAYWRLMGKEIERNASTTL